MMFGDDLVTVRHASRGDAQNGTCTSIDSGSTRAAAPARRCLSARAVGSHRDGRPRRSGRLWDRRCIAAPARRAERNDSRRYEFSGVLAFMRRPLQGIHCAVRSGNQPRRASNAGKALPASRRSPGNLHDRHEDPAQSDAQVVKVACSNCNLREPVRMPLGLTCAGNRAAG
jgi:hypothetical protein